MDVKFRQKTPFIPPFYEFIPSDEQRKNKKTSQVGTTQTRPMHSFHIVCEKKKKAPVPVEGLSDLDFPCPNCKKRHRSNKKKEKSCNRLYILKSRPVRLRRQWGKKTCNRALRKEAKREKARQIHVKARQPLISSAASSCFRHAAAPLLRVHSRDRASSPCAPAHPNPPPPPRRH